MSLVIEILGVLKEYGFWAMVLGITIAALKYFESETKLIGRILKRLGDKAYYKFDKLVPDIAVKEQLKDNIARFKIDNLLENFMNAHGGVKITRTKCNPPVDNPYAEWTTWKISMKDEVYTEDTISSKEKIQNLDIKTMLDLARQLFRDNFLIVVTDEFDGVGIEVPYKNEVPLVNYKYLYDIRKEGNIKMTLYYLTCKMVGGTFLPDELYGISYIKIPDIETIMYTLSGLEEIATIVNYTILNKIEDDLM